MDSLEEIKKEIYNHHLECCCIEEGHGDPAFGMPLLMPVFLGRCTHFPEGGIKSEMFEFWQASEINNFQWLWKIFKSNFNFHGTSCSSYRS